MARSTSRALRAALARYGPAQAVLLEMKKSLDAMYRGYRLRALFFAVLGAVAIAALLLVALRSVRRSWDVLAPLAAAVVVSAALLLATGTRLNIFHLVALLLVIGAIGIAVALLVALLSWNDFAGALVLLQRPAVFTAPLALTTFSTFYATDEGLRFAGLAITFLPPLIVFLVLQRSFVQGLSVGTSR